MIKNLAEAAGRIEIASNVCIVGAGIAGLLTAWRLNKKGISAVLLESGPRDADDTAHQLNTVEQLGQEYKGATRAIPLSRRDVHTLGRAARHLSAAG